MTEKGRWSRGAIDAFLARGGDIKAVDKFLLRGGQIPRKEPKISGTIGSFGQFGSNWHFGQVYSGYVEDDNGRLTKSCGGALHDDYSEESFP